MLVIYTNLLDLEYLSYYKEEQSAYPLRNCILMKSSQD